MRQNWNTLAADIFWPTIVRLTSQFQLTAMWRGSGHPFFQFEVPFMAQLRNSKSRQITIEANFYDKRFLS
jgi:hypothetical protein